jgi:Fur family peroxide stress response transcriptional regulator
MPRCDACSEAPQSSGRLPSSPRPANAPREHPSAEQIHQAVRDRLPRLSLATVYKNLEALRAIGAVSDVNSLHEHGRYEAALPGTGAGQPHHHLVCISCKRVLDLYDKRFDDVRFGAE